MHRLVLGRSVSFACAVLSYPFLFRSRVAMTLATAATALAGFVFNVLLIFAPAVGYIDQCVAIRSSRRHCEGYAATASLILLVCNSLRICYFIAGEHFAVALLLQSAWMVLVQCALIVVVINATVLLHHSRLPLGFSQVARRADVVASAGGYTSTRSARTFLSEFFVAFSVLACVAWLVSSYAPAFAVVFGYSALLIEATLLLPQLRLNAERQSVAGVTWSLLVTWIAGDVVKMLYFVAAAQPTPFVVCGSLQLCLDAVLLSQIVRFGQSSSAAALSLAKGDDEEDGDDLSAKPTIVMTSSSSATRRRPTGDSDLHELHVNDSVSVGPIVHNLDTATNGIAEQVGLRRINSGAVNVVTPITAAVVDDRSVPRHSARVSPDDSRVLTPHSQ